MTYLFARTVALMCLIAFVVGVYVHINLWWSMSRTCRISFITLATMIGGLVSFVLALSFGA